MIKARVTVCSSLPVVGGGSWLGWSNLPSGLLILLIFRLKKQLILFRFNIVLYPLQHCSELYYVLFWLLSVLFVYFLWFLYLEYEVILEVSFDIMVISCSHFPSKCHCNSITGIMTYYIFILVTVFSIISFHSL